MTGDLKQSDLRGLNADIAESYDRMPYDPPAVPAIDPPRVFGLAALHGDVTAKSDFDILDLGCGTGSQLEQVAGQTTGRVVGIDLSRSACDQAAARVAKYGARCTVTCADFLDLDAASLGQFDLIYHIGVLYVTPPEVQRRILALIAACLKPGGVAVISHYFGSTALIMGGLHQMLKAVIDPSDSPQAKVKAARARLQDMAGMLARQGGDRRALVSLLEQLQARPDVIFFHETLNAHFEALSTSSLEAELGAHGVHFLNWMIMPGPFGAIAAPRERALAADSLDLASGGYHYAAFAKSPASTPVSVRAANVQWHSRLRRLPAKPGAGAVFRDEKLGLTMTPDAVTETTLDLLAQGGCDWPRLSNAAGAASAALEQELVILWQHGLLVPLYSFKP